MIRPISKKWKKFIVNATGMTTAYISEGLVFLFVILIGAIFLYSAIMRQITDPTTATEFHDGHYP